MSHDGENEVYHGSSEDETIAPAGDIGSTPEGSEEQTIIRNLGMQPSPAPQADQETVVRGGLEEAADRTVIFAARARRLGYLVEKTGPRASYVHHLGDQNSLGRAGDNDIVIDDEHVSQAHAKIRLEDDAFILHDLASTNGTWLLRPEGKTAVREPHRLKEGDVVRLGRMEFIFMDIDESFLVEED